MVFLCSKSAVKVRLSYELMILVRSCIHFIEFKDSIWYSNLARAVYNRYVLPTNFHETLLDNIANQKSGYAEKVGCTALKLVVTTHEYSMLAREVKIFEIDVALCS
jgi:hypothetical protein